ncbi:MAG: radical SAM protein [Epulopiscium sp.]|jgi:pyruvate formate lyase activating enzyme|nr:radical SAM protein [Candidatus Epulonipiscium sp.]
MDNKTDAQGGYILQLQNFSVNDGDGIRTTIFMAGCPLRCAWCANPEGFTLKNPMTHYVTVEVVVKKIKKQMIFYRNSGGGITFSGGEATFQPDFLRSMVNRMYDMGLHLAIETCGYFSFEEVYDILQKMDLIFMDMKHMDSHQHLTWTQKENTLILENIQKVSTLGIPMVLRIPTIVGVNASMEHMKSVFEWMESTVPHAKLEFLPYHRFGEYKYEQLRLKLPQTSFETPDDALIKAFTQLAQQYGIEVVSYR